MKYVDICLKTVGSNKLCWADGLMKRTHEMVLKVQRSPIQ